MPKNSLRRKTKRLEIRRLRASDYKAWKKAQVEMPAAKNKWDLGPKAQKDLTRAQFDALLKRQAQLRAMGTFYYFAVFNKEGDHLGAVSLMEVSRGISHTAFLGYRIFNPYWGRGIAKEAARLAIDIGFTDLNLHRIEAGIEPGNRRSIALAKSLGMRREGLKKRAIYLRGDWVDLVMYTLTTEDLGYKFDKKILYQKRWY